MLNIKDADNHYLIAGKTVTGFTTAEERIAGKTKIVPFLNQKEVGKRGGNFTKKRFYSEYAVQDGRLLTGHNPFSVRAVAKLLIAEIG